MLHRAKPFFEEPCDRLAYVKKRLFPPAPNYYRHHLHHIIAPLDGRILDSCAGEGTALVTLSNCLPGRLLKHLHSRPRQLFLSYLLV